MDNVLQFYFTLRGYKVLSIIKLTTILGQHDQVQGKGRIEIYVIDISDAPTASLSELCGNGSIAKQTTKHKEGKEDT